LFSGVRSLSITRIQIKQAINPADIRRILTIAPICGIMEKSTLKGAAIKFQKPVMLF
jgi:hypothetical protein